MTVTAIEGIVENGTIRLREGLTLAENTRVYVIVADALAARPPEMRSPRLADPRQARDFHKQVLESPGDASL